MPRYICDFKGPVVTARDWEDARILQGCNSCISQNNLPCGGPTKLWEKTPEQLLLPFNTNPEEE